MQELNEGTDENKAAMEAKPGILAREYPGGVVAIDSGMIRREMAACFLLECGEELAIIETGNRASAERILTVAKKRGWKETQISQVIVTHVHLDHAGGAGLLIQQCPNARLVVHPRGVRHMIDPSRLEASARKVYGDQAFDAMYGTLVPVPEERTLIMEDEDTLDVGDRRLEFMDSPGHARHHFCVWDEQTRGWFTGDTFGVSYRDLDTADGPFIFPTTTPIQFDPEALITSIERLMKKSPDYMYLTHFGRVGDVRRLADQMIDSVRCFRDIGEKNRDSANRTEAIRHDMLTWLKRSTRAHGVGLPEAGLEELLTGDVSLNTQGIEFWLDQKKPGG